MVKSRPPKNRDPLPDEIATACRPWLDTQVRLVDPKVVVTLGNFAARTLLETTTGISRLRGRTYPFQGRVLLPTFHPAAALRGAADGRAGPAGGDGRLRVLAELLAAQAPVDEDRPSSSWGCSEHGHELLSADEATTRAIRAAVAGLLDPGDVVGLAGDLGAEQDPAGPGAADALGADGPVLSRPSCTVPRVRRRPAHPPRRRPAASAAPWSWRTWAWRTSSRPTRWCSSSGPTRSPPPSRAGWSWSSTSTTTTGADRSASTAIAGRPGRGSWPTALAPFPRHA